MGQKRSQEELRDLMRAEKCLREAADTLADKDGDEDGELEFNRCAYDHLQEVQPLIHASAKISRTATPPESTALEALQCARDDFEHDANAYLLAYRFVQVVLRLLLVVSRRALAPLKRFIHSA